MPEERASVVDSVYNANTTIVLLVSLAQYIKD